MVPGADIFEFPTLTGHAPGEHEAVRAQLGNVWGYEVAQAINDIEVYPVLLADLAKEEVVRRFMLFDWTLLACSYWSGAYWRELAFYAEQLREMCRAEALRRSVVLISAGEVAPSWH